MQIQQDHAKAKAAFAVNTVIATNTRHRHTANTAFTVKAVLKKAKHKKQLLQ
jgi:hypothetical protein